jgi:hypothetical protein
MKRFLLASLLALVLLAGSHQTASAWSKWNVMVGVNVSYEGGGNSFLWGLARSAPYPGGYGWGGGDHYAGDYGYHGYPASYQTQPQQWQAPAPAPAPAPQQNPPATTPGTQQTTQAVGYYYYGYTNYQAPSYWYGR